MVVESDRGFADFQYSPTCAQTGKASVKSSSSSILIVSSGEISSIGVESIWIQQKTSTSSMRASSFKAAQQFRGIVTSA